MGSAYEFDLDKSNNEQFDLFLSDQSELSDYNEEEEIKLQKKSSNVLAVH